MYGFADVPWEDLYEDQQEEYRRGAQACLQAAVPVLMGENAKLKKEREWQPIETAPRDGTEVLAWSKQGSNWHQVYWKAWENGWQWKEKFLPRWGMRWNEEYFQCDADFTHWMPIPSAPGDAGEGR